jgi:hypothetical protein
MFHCGTSPQPSADSKDLYAKRIVGSTGQFACTGDNAAMGPFWLFLEKDVLNLRS